MTPNDLAEIEAFDGRVTLTPECMRDLCAALRESWRERDAAQARCTLVFEKKTEIANDLRAHIAELEKKNAGWIKFQKHIAHCVDAPSPDDDMPEFMCPCCEQIDAK